MKHFTYYRSGRIVYLPSRKFIQWQTIRIFSPAVYKLRESTDCIYFIFLSASFPTFQLFLTATFIFHLHSPVLWILLFYFFVFYETLETLCQFSEGVSVLYYMFSDSHLFHDCLILSLNRSPIVAGLKFINVSWLVFCWIIWRKN